ncbi:ABC transporter permease [Streptomyces sp. NPDC051162]|uniref:ABC transporter permease n=1 Tax=Streptomyces sp. NPDC051162 TaxID=3154747 RepID=UPI00343C3AD0
MSTTAGTTKGTEAGKQPPRLLRGMAWLVWRQHRTALVACLVLAASASVYMLWERAAAVDYLSGDRMGIPDGEFRMAFQGTAYASAFQNGSWVMSMLPVALGVFLGAPLIAGDLERGTLRLVTTQSMTRRRWLGTKTGTAVLVTLLCSVGLSLAFTFWWRAVHGATFADWTESSDFDTTGPMPVALSLLYLAVGIAFGVFVRRVLPAMVLTFGFGFAMNLVWDRIRLLPFTPRQITGPVEQGQPAVPAGGARFDNWTVDAQGKLHGFGACANERTPAECRANKGIVAERLEYFGHDQMSAMQWTWAGILLAAALAIAGLTVWWIRRRPL